MGRSYFISPNAGIIKIMIKDHKIEKRKLSSGGELLNVIIPGLPFSIASVWFRAGARFDPKGKDGLAHFFEHLLMVRTEKYPDRKSLSQALETKGIYVNAMTARETAHYYHIQPSEHTYESLRFLLGGLNTSLITKEDVENEKEVIINESFRVHNDPESFSWHLSMSGFFPESSLGGKFFGDKKTIKSISINDINDFKEKHYSSGEKLFLVIGNESTTKLQKYIEKNHALSMDRKNKSSKAAEEFHKPKKINIDRRKIDQVFVSAGFTTTTVKNSKDTIVLDLIREYLADRWIAQLVEKMRVENNLTYWVSGDSENYTDAGYLRFHFSVDRKNLKKSLAILAEEFENIKNSKVNGDVLDNIKTSYESALVRNCFDPIRMLWWYGLDAILGGETISLAEYIKKMKLITPEQIKRVANKYFIKENLSLTFIGDVSEKDIVFDFK